MLHRLMSSGREDHTLPEVTISYYGNYFRSYAYTHPDAENFTCTYYEAVEHPISHKWQVQEVWIRPDINGQEGEKVESRKTAKNGKNLSLKDALSLVGKYQSQQKSMLYNKADDHNSGLGDTHVTAFAALNEYALDQSGKAHATVHGRIIDEGTFALGTSEYIQAQLQKPKTEKPIKPPSGLSHFFRSALQADDLTRFLDTREILQKWNGFIEDIDKIISLFSSCQDNNFKLTDSEKGIHKITAPEDFLAMKLKIDNAKKSIKQFDFLDTAQKDNIHRFFTEIICATEIAYAIYIYQQYERGHVSRENFEAQLKEAEKSCKNAGGTEEDIKKIRGHAIYFEEKHWLNLQDPYDSPSIGFNKHYFFPEELLKIKQDIKHIKLDLEEALDQEKRRMIAQSPPESRFAHD